MKRTDCFSPEKRSQIMAAVAHEDTDIELKLRKALWQRGMRYRKHHHIANTRPDICFLKSRLAIFVDGCFWHGCPRHYKPPQANRELWQKKLTRNQERDRKNFRDLTCIGWKVMRFWECEIDVDLPHVIKQIEETLSR